MVKQFNKPSPQSFIGKSYLNPESEVIGAPSKINSEFGKRMEHLNRLYCDFLSYVKDETITSNCDFEKASTLDHRVSSYHALLDEENANLLDTNPKINIKNKITHFEKLVEWRYSLLEKEFMQLSQRLINLDKKISQKYIDEQIPTLDFLAQQCYQWQHRSWLEGKVVLNKNSSVDNYVALLGALKKEEPFWSGFQEKYVSKIFGNQKEAEKELSYIQQKFQDHFQLYLKGERLPAWRVEESTAGKVLSDLVELNKNFSKHNPVKQFVTTSLSKLEQKHALLNNADGTELKEIKNSFHSVYDCFSEVQDLLYFREVVLNYEEKRAVLEREIVAKLVSSLPPTHSSSAHNLSFSIYPTYFNLVDYLKDYTPNSPELQQMQIILQSDGQMPWSDKINHLKNILKNNYGGYSTRDADYLGEVVFAFETELREGSLSSLSIENHSLRRQMQSFLSELKDYRKEYIN